MRQNVKPTQEPVPSSDIKNLFFNSGLLDIWATSLERKYIDRFGDCHLTASGMEWLFKELVEKFKVDMNTAIVAAGYITIDSFQQGADLPNNEITLRNHILRDETTGEYYRWDGDLPKTVPAGSTPQSTGGIGKGAWVSVGDASLRSELGNGIKTISTISELENYFPEKSNKLVYVNAYHSRNRYKAGELDGGGQFVYDREMPRSKHDGGNIISPTVPWSANVSYLKGFGESAPLLNGCWVRQTSDVYAGNYGVITGSRDDGKYNAAIINEIQSKLDKSDRLILPKGEVYIGSHLDFGKSKSIFGYNPIISPAYELSWTYTNLIIDHAENAISYGTSCRFYGLLVTQADASTYYKTAAFVAKSDDYDGGARSQFNCISTWHFKVGIYANRWSCVFNAIASTVKYTDPTKYTPTCSILLAGPVNNCEVRNCRLENTTVGGSTGIVIREEITDSNPDEFGVIPTDTAAQNDDTGGLNSLRTGGAMLRIENNDLTECYSGIKIIKTVKTVITGNYFENNTRDITIDGGAGKSFGRVDVLENNASKRIASQRYVIVESGSGIINLSGNNVTGANNHTTDGEVIIASDDDDAVIINSENNSSTRGRWFASTTAVRRSRISSSRTGVISFTVDLSKGNQWFFFSLPNIGEVLFTHASQIRGNFITPNGATFSVGYQAGGIVLLKHSSKNVQ